MFERVLLPVDLTERSESAIAPTLELLAGTDGTAILLHVIETIEDAAFEDLEDFYRRLEDKARRRLRELARPLESGGAAVEQRVVYGKRAREIVAFADEHRADLIVLSSRPLDPANPAAAWGSISHQVAILARCSVLLVK